MIIDGYSAEDINKNAMNQYILKRNSELIDRKEFDSYSLTTKLSALRNKGIITDNDYKRLRGALNLEKAIKDIKTEISTYFNMIGTDKDYEQGYNNAIKRALTIIDKHIGVKE